MSMSTRPDEKTSDDDTSKRKANPPALDISMLQPSPFITIPPSDASRRGRSRSANSHLAAPNSADSHRTLALYDNSSGLDSSASSLISPRRHSTSSTSSTIVTSPASSSVSPAISEMSTPQPLGTSPITPLSAYNFTLTGSPQLSALNQPHEFKYIDDLAMLEAKAKAIQLKTKEGQAQLLAQVLSGKNFTKKFYGLSKEQNESLIMSYITHIWEEAIEILSFALYNVPFGIFYPHGVNMTVMQAGPEVLNTMFKPEKVAFLSEFGDKADFCVRHLRSLFPKYGPKINFNFENAIIFIPICYTATVHNHALMGEKFFEVMKFFLFEKNCKVMVYLGRDAGLNENIEKRNKWLENNEHYIQQIRDMNPEFWAENSADKLTLVHRSELVKGLQYLNAEASFVEVLVNPHSNVFNAMLEDVTKRLVEKGYQTSKSGSLRPKTPTVPVEQMIPPLEPSLGSNSSTLFGAGSAIQSRIASKLHDIKSSTSSSELDNILKTIMRQPDKFARTLRGGVHDNLPARASSASARSFSDDIDDSKEEMDSNTHRKGYSSGS